MADLRDVFYEFEIAGEIKQLSRRHLTCRVHKDVQEEELRELMEDLIEEYYGNLEGPDPYGWKSTYSFVHLYFDDPKDEFEHVPLCSMSFNGDYFVLGE